jgi:Flp pilus assembly protein TadD
MSDDVLQAGFKEADHLMQIGNYSAAIKLLKKFRKKYPKEALISFNLGVVYYKAEMFIKSIYSLEEAISLGADNSEVYNQLGLACDKNGDTEGGRAYFKKALDDNPLFAMAWNNLGVSYFLTQDYLSARAYFEKAVEMNNEDPDCWFNLRDTYIELGLRDEAELADIKYHELVRH